MRAIDSAQQLRSKSPAGVGRKLFQGPISDLLDRTEVGDLVYVKDSGFPPGNYRVIEITYQRCCKAFVLENGETVLCSRTRPTFPKFVPTDEERSRGKYAIVFEKRTAAGEWDISSTAHIMPLCGRNHLIHETCWCGPSRENDDGGAYFFVHSASQ